MRVKANDTIRQFLTEYSSSFSEKQLDHEAAAVSLDTIKEMCREMRDLHPDQALRYWPSKVMGSFPKLFVDQSRHQVLVKADMELLERQYRSAASSRDGHTRCMAEGQGEARQLSRLVGAVANILLGASATFLLLCLVAKCQVHVSLISATAVGIFIAVAEGYFLSKHLG